MQILQLCDTQIQPGLNMVSAVPKKSELVYKSKQIACEQAHLFGVSCEFLSNLRRTQSLQAFCQRSVAWRDSGIIYNQLFGYFYWFLFCKPINCNKKSQRIFKEIPLCQSFFRRPTADKESEKLWARDWFLGGWGRDL